MARRKPRQKAAQAEAVPTSKNQEKDQNDPSPDESDDPDIAASHGSDIAASALPQPKPQISVDPDSARQRYITAAANSIGATEVDLRHFGHLSALEQRLEDRVITLRSSKGGGSFIVPGHGR